MVVVVLVVKVVVACVEVVVATVVEVVEVVVSKSVDVVVDTTPVELQLSVTKANITKKPVKRAIAIMFFIFSPYSYYSHGSLAREHQLILGSRR